MAYSPNFQKVKFIIGYRVVSNISNWFFKLLNYKFTRTAAQKLQSDNDPQFVNCQHNQSMTMMGILSTWNLFKLPWPFSSPSLQWN